MSETSIHISATSGSPYLYRRPMLDSFSCGQQQHSKVPGHILVEFFRNGQGGIIYTSVRNATGHYSLGQLGILWENLLCSSGKQPANFN
jgi:hypothetical protein